MKTETTKKTLSDNLRSELEKLQNNNNGKIEFTQEENNLLLEFWPIKLQSEIAKIFGMSENTLRKRYRELKKIEDYIPAMASINDKN
jgi:hypothetical protein